MKFPVGGMITKVGKKVEMISKWNVLKMVSMFYDKVSLKIDWSH